MTSFASTARAIDPRCDPSDVPLLRSLVRSSRPMLGRVAAAASTRCWCVSVLGTGGSEPSASPMLGAGGMVGRAVTPAHTMLHVHIKPSHPIERVRGFADAKCSASSASGFARTDLCAQTCGYALLLPPPLCVHAKMCVRVHAHVRTEEAG